MVLTRFAPSPTGYLHLGHAASAFSVWERAKTLGGTVLLRIEDIDHTRCRPEYETAILEDLKWLGFEWRPTIRRQSDHISNFHDVISKLSKRGLVYRCFRTRAEIAALSDPDGNFRGAPLPPDQEQEKVARGDAFAWRLSLSAARDELGPLIDALHYKELAHHTLKDIAVNCDFGDVILARKDIQTSYHVACCHDDAHQKITHVIRGEDLRAVTHIHVLLQTLMGWPNPIYSFHPLVLGRDGQKLSKGNQDKALRDYRDEGVTPDQIMGMCGFR